MIVVNFEYKPLYLNVSKDTPLKHIKILVGWHTGYTIDCISFFYNNETNFIQLSKVFNQQNSVKDVDWFYQKHNIKAVLENGTSWCQNFKNKCGFGVKPLKHENVSAEISLCC